MSKNYLDDLQAAAPKIQVKIGASLDVTYLVMHTTAEKNYDGFGTLTLVEGISVGNRSMDGRVVLIREEHFNWQVMRYGSGLNASEAGDVDLLPEYERRVIQKLFGKEE